MEQDVLRYLHAAGRPMTAAEVQADLRGDLAYSTAATTLIRLHDKGALIRVGAARRYAYTVVGPPATVSAAITARRMRRLLDADTNRRAVLARLVTILDPEDHAVLTRLLAATATGPRPHEHADTSPGHAPSASDEAPRRAARKPT